MMLTISFKNSSRTTQLSSTTEREMLFVPFSFDSPFTLVCPPMPGVKSVSVWSKEDGALACDGGRGNLAEDHGPVAMGDDGRASRAMPESDHSAC